jgi:hypothetical protein
VRPFDFTRYVDKNERELRDSLSRLASPGELRDIVVEPEDGEIAAGTRPSGVFRDQRGRKYIFKAAEPEHVAAEELAFEIRKFGGRPSVPVAARELVLPGVGSASGMIQPIVEHADTRLDLEPARWSPLQREVMLREHVWEWLLANLDTHADQYILVGPQMHPLNIDWDHALVDLNVTELTRFTKRSVAIAPVRNLLYDAHVHHRIRLDFFGLRREVARASQIDDSTLSRLVARYAATAQIAGADQREILDRMIARKRDLRRTFELLIASMRLERIEDVSTTRGPWSSSVRRMGTAYQDFWQRLVVTVLHDKVLRHVFRAYRKVLAARVPASDMLRGTPSGGEKD